MAAVSTEREVARSVIQIRISPERKRRWQEYANRAGMTLSGFINSSVENEIGLQRALELQVEDERRRQEARERAER